MSYKKVALICNLFLFYTYKLKTINNYGKGNEIFGW